MTEVPTEEDIKDTMRFIGVVLISILTFVLIIAAAIGAMFLVCGWLAAEAEKEPAWETITITEKQIVGGKYGPNYLVMAGDRAYECNLYRFNELHVGENRVVTYNYYIHEVDID